MPIERGDTTWRVKGTGVGERFVDGVHEQGTEVKAITYSAMQIVERSEAEAEAAVADDSNPGARRRAELFVIVDI
jgi:SHS2 domain-containing protein